MSVLEEAPGLDFLQYFEDLPDPRQPWKVIYTVVEMLLVTLCGVICGAEGWVEVATFGESRLEYLRQFLPYTRGIPSHDTLGDFFSRLEPQAFQRCFIEWVESFQKGLQGVVAIDGKTLRHSFDENQSPIHMVSAWASRMEMVLGQEKVDSKSNEIKAIPKLLDLLSLKGAIVTLDAMGCQKEIANKIREKEADYILALKGNQSSLHEDVALFLTQQKETGALKSFQTTDADHGRIEVRDCFVSTDIEWLRTRYPAWTSLNSLAMIRSQRTLKKTGKTSVETRYYLSSLPAPTAETMANAIRSHWGIENKVHWVLDVAFGSDDCRIRQDHAPQNFSAIQQMALNLVRKAKKTKLSIRCKRLKAALDPDFLSNILQST